MSISREYQLIRDLALMLEAAQPINPKDEKKFSDVVADARKYMERKG